MVALKALCAPKMRNHAFKVLKRLGASKTLKAVFSLFVGGEVCRKVQIIPGPNYQDPKLRPFKKKGPEVVKPFAAPIPLKQIIFDW